MINVAKENLISLTDAAKKLPRRRSGKRPHIATLYRWAQRGLHGVRLETLQAGGSRCTSVEALARFFAELGDRNSSESVTPRVSRRHQLERATRLARQMVN